MNETESCFICRENISEISLMTCESKHVPMCPYRVHDSCRSLWYQKQKKVLPCPCGNNYGEYKGPRSSLTFLSCFYSFLIFFKALPWNNVHYSFLFQPILKIILMAGLVAHFTSPVVAAFLFGGPLITLSFSCLIIIGIKNITERSRHLPFFSNLINDSSSNLEKLVYSISTMSIQNYDFLQHLLPLLEEIKNT